MDVEVKAKWVAALRSGEYEQCTGKLKDGTGHCCLGVLGEVTGLPFSYLGTAFTDGENMVGYIPLRVHFNDSVMDTLWRLNDRDKLSFNEIADYIEANL